MGYNSFHGKEAANVTASQRFNVWYLVLACVGVWTMHGLWVQATQVRQIPYSEFRSLLETGRIESVAVGSDRIDGELRGPIEGATRFVTVRVEPEIAADLQNHGVRYAGRIESDLIPMVLSWVVPVLLFVGLWMLVARRMAQGPGGAGFMALGKSKAKVYVETAVPVKFDDVAGVDEAKDELREIVAFLRDPAVGGRLGARMPKGVLLVGPPGTGKTLLARAVAGEAGVPFFSISGSEFVEMFVGVGAARVRDLFEQAREKAPCIIFIDELDALGRARNTHPGVGAHDEKEQTLNQLLVELDGFDGASGIVLLAATNRPEVLDPALLRAGRFDRQILVDRPDRRGRVAILAVHLKKIRLADGVSAESIAALTPGFTGADLANLANEAALVATRRGSHQVEAGDFQAAIERIVAGLERKNRLLNPFEKEVVAYHEMGHAAVAAATPGSDAVHKISIIPRGIGALGYTMQRPTDDRYLMTREELEGRMTVLLGGRAAERVVFGHLSTGAADDLARATDIARDMVLRFAMVPELGHVAYGSDATAGFLGGSVRTKDYSEATAREIDCAVRALVGRAYERAVEIVERHLGVVESGARILLEKETLEAAEIDELMAALKSPRIEPAPRRAA
jgi:cell division protease FtsH